MTVMSVFVKAGIIDIPLPEDTIPLAETTDKLPLAVVAIFHSIKEESDF
jgi:hypothetical protein